MLARFGLGLAAALSCAGFGPAFAGGLFEDDVADVMRTETFSAEASAGYLRATSTEYFYRVPGNGAKLSQLNWSADAAVLGGRVAVRALDWLTIRGRGWATVGSDGKMTDYDWRAGYYGRNSWTDRSISPNTDLSRAWQADVSLAARFWQDEDTALTAIVGFRHYDASWQASGGTYLYSSYALRDTAGNLPSSVGITYRQTWDTPYLGLGLSANKDDWTVTAEFIGSPFAMLSDRDHHVLRDLVFEDRSATAGMIGVNAGLEYRLSELLSLTGRVEYQKYFEAQGKRRAVYTETGATFNQPRPAAGADAETLLLTVGLKARL